MRLWKITFSWPQRDSDKPSEASGGVRSALLTLIIVERSAADREWGHNSRIERIL